MSFADDLILAYAGFVGALLRDLNSAIYVMQEIPDWREKFARAKADALLNEKPERIAELCRQLADYAAGHQEANPEFLAQLERLQKALHEQLQ